MTQAGQPKPPQTPHPWASQTGTYSADGLKDPSHATQDALDSPLQGLMDPAFTLQWEDRPDDLGPAGTTIPGAYGPSTHQTGMA